MKTSVMKVHDMLSVLSVPGVEERIGQVPGVESVTVNFAAGSATVRYDETRLEIADIKAGVRQGAFESAAPAAPSTGDNHDGRTASSAPPAAPVAAAPEPSAGAPSAVPEPTSLAPISDADAGHVHGGPEEKGAPAKG